jgi:hypothetical protein
MKWKIILSICFALGMGLIGYYVLRAAIGIAPFLRVGQF